MAEQDKKRYFWIKLEKDFFKRHDIRIVESMPNGKDYILFYLKLLCESTSHEGYLRFSQTIPYSIEMLSTITNTNIDIVRSAIEIFSQLNMMKILDDGTLFLEQVSRLIGSETHEAIRKREYRENNKKSLKWDNVPELSGQCHLDIDKELDIDIELEEKKEVAVATKKESNHQASYDSVRECLIQTFLPKGILWSVAHDKMVEQWLLNYPPEFINQTVMDIALDSSKIGNFKYLSKALEGKWNDQFKSNQTKEEADEAITDDQIKRALEEMRKVRELKRSNL